MNQKKRVLSLVLALALLAGCGSRTVESGNSQPGPSELPVEEVEEAPEGILDQMDSLYDLLDNAALPLKGPEAYAALGSFDGGPQLVKDDETAKKLAGAIYGCLDPYGNGLGAYTEDDDLSIARTTTALYHTAPIDFAWEFSREGEFTCSAGGHVLAALAKRELESGRTPVAFYYADDVKKTAEQLFGSGARVTNIDAPPYYYYEKENVYILMETLGPPEYIPQILSYEKTADGYSVEAVLVHLTPEGLEYDAQLLTKENFMELTARAQRLRYVFRETEGGMTLASLEPWRPENQ